MRSNRINIKVLCSGILLFLQALTATAQILSPAVIQTEAIRVAGITTDAQIYGLTPAQKTTMKVFLDGLGRTIQTINVNSSPQLNDIISYNSYNSLGQQLSAFLPYVNGNTGMYHPAAASEQTAYYGNGVGDKVVDDTKPWQQEVVEQSPLQRILYIGSEGNGFQPSPGDNTQHYKSVLQRTNNSTAYVNDSYNTGIRIWKYDGTSSGIYPTGSLSVTEVLDESNNTTVTYTDIHHRLILKRRIITAQVIDGSTEYCQDTYYVYDDAGECRMIIPPKALALTRNANASPWNALSAASAYVFQYNYDALGRLVEKKVPSADWVYVVYDPLNRPVLTQDGNQRLASNWTYYKYDSKERLASQGVYTDAVNGTSRTAMQTYVSGLNYSSYTYEEKQGGSGPNFYTNRIFPTTNQNSSALLDLTYYYYDNYDFNADGTSDYSYHTQGLSGEASATNYTRGMPTGTYNRTLNNDGTLNVWLQKIIFFDKRGKFIQSLSNNHTNSASVGDITTVVPDFSGATQLVKIAKVVSGTTTTTLLTYGYDGSRHLATIDQANNGGTAVRVVQYVLNELGQLVTKRLHSTDDVNFFQNVDLRYNINGSITSINNSTLSVDNTNNTNSDANDLFGEDILYEKTDAAIGNTAYYNGEISAVKWESQSSVNNSQRSYVYSYDQLDRMISAHYQDRAYQSTGAWGNAGNNDETGIAYDLSGNIKNLKRYGTGTLIDNLTYTYSGDQLNNVSDAGTTAGFNGTNTGAYTYDNNGNLTADPKKGVVLTYNILNKVDKITFTASGNYIRYTYDAQGGILRKETYASGSTTTYDYIDGFVYQNLTLSYFPTAEGRVRSNSGTLVFEYFIRDHLGNVRVSFDGVGSSAVAREENSYYPFGEILPGNLLPGVPNNLLFNGGAEWQHDFGPLPDLYQTFFRNYDAAIGRFIAVDPEAYESAATTPYHFAGNNPVNANDPNGNVVLLDCVSCWLDPVTVIGYIPSSGGISQGDWDALTGGVGLFAGGGSGAPGSGGGPGAGGGNGYGAYGSGGGSGGVGGGGIRPIGGGGNLPGGPGGPGDGVFGGWKPLTKDVLVQYIKKHSGMKFPSKGAWENYIGGVFERTWNAFAQANLDHNDDYQPNTEKYITDMGGTVPDGVSNLYYINPKTGKVDLTIPGGVFWEATTWKHIEFWSKKGLQIRKQMRALSHVPTPPFMSGPIENVVTPFDSELSWKIRNIQSIWDGVQVYHIVAGYQEIGGMMFVTFGIDVGGVFFPSPMKLTYTPAVLDDHF